MENMWFTENAFVDFKNRKVIFSDAEPGDSPDIPKGNVGFLIEYLAEHKTEKWFTADDLRKAVWGEEVVKEEYDSSILAQEIKTTRELFRCTKDTFLKYERKRNAYRFNPPNDKADPVIVKFSENSCHMKDNEDPYREKERNEYEAWLNEHEKARAYEQRCIMNFITSKCISSIIIKSMCVSLIITVVSYILLSSLSAYSNNWLRYFVCCEIFIVTGIIGLMNRKSHGVDHDIDRIINRYNWIKELRKMYDNSRYEITYNVERLLHTVIILYCFASIMALFWVFFFILT